MYLLINFLAVVLKQQWMVLHFPVSNILNVYRISQENISIFREVGCDRLSEQTATTTEVSSLLIILPYRQHQDVILNIAYKVI